MVKELLIRMLCINRTGDMIWIDPRASSTVLSACLGHGTGGGHATRDSRRMHLSTGPHGRQIRCLLRLRQNVAIARHLIKRRIKAVIWRGLRCLRGSVVNSSGRLLLPSCLRGRRLGYDIVPARGCRCRGRVLVICTSSALGTRRA